MSDTAVFVDVLFDLHRISRDIDQYWTAQDSQSGSVFLRTSLVFFRQIFSSVYLDTFESNTTSDWLNLTL